MFAVIKTGGKQYKVHEGDIIRVERLKHEPGQSFPIQEILMIGDQSQVSFDGTKVSVEAEVVEHFRDKKILIFKKKRRKNYRRHGGHKQHLSKIKITKIVGI